MSANKQKEIVDSGEDLHSGEEPEDEEEVGEIEEIEEEEEEQPIPTKSPKHSSPSQETKTLPDRTKPSSKQKPKRPTNQVPDEAAEEASSYSDLDSQQSTTGPRRRYRRGGRKNTNHRTAKADVEAGEDGNNLEVEILDQGENKITMLNQDSEGEGVGETCAHCGQAARPALGSKRRTKKRRPGFEDGGIDGTGAETGIRGFNLKKAQEPGGGKKKKGVRPFGITLEKPRAKSSTTTQSQSQSSKAGPSRTKKHTSDNNQVRKNTQDEEGSGSEESEEEDDEEDEEQLKPEKEERECVSIRLDLNLELEIFLKAKIKGDVTITFL